MPSAVDKDDVSRSLLAFVADGKYPDSEDVVSAEFSSSLLPKGLQDIAQARAQLEVSNDGSQCWHIANNMWFRMK